MRHAIDAGDTASSAHSAAAGQWGAWTEDASLGVAMVAVRATGYALKLDAYD